MLRQLAEDLWVADYDQFLPGKVNFTARMTIVKLADGSLWLHSPIKLDDELAAQIDALGPVAHIVAPSCFHYLYVAPYVERWPDARSYAAPGLREKREDLSFDEVLTDQAPEAWRGQIDQLIYGGAPTVNEVLFRHVPSKTLVVTDLVFNLHQFKGLMTGLVLRMVGAHKCFAHSRSWKWIFTKDKDAARKSAAALLEWDFDRVIMCHGDVLESGGHAAIEEALAWLGSSSPTDS